MYKIKRFLVYHIEEFKQMAWGARFEMILNLIILSMLLLTGAVLFNIGNWLQGTLVLFALAHYITFTKLGNIDKRIKGGL